MGLGTLKYCQCPDPERIIFCHFWGFFFFFLSSFKILIPRNKQCSSLGKEATRWWVEVWGVFPGGTSGKEFAWQCRRQKRPGFDPWVGRTPRGGHGNPLQCSWLRNPMDRGAWWATAHRVTQSQTWLKWLRTCVHRGLRTPRFNSLIRFSSGEDVILLEKVKLERIMNKQKSVCAHDMLIIARASKDRENMYYPTALWWLVNLSLFLNRHWIPWSKSHVLFIFVCLPSHRHSQTHSISTHCMKEWINVH